MQTNKESVSVLNDLIETCKDGEYGFQTCADNADSPNLKAKLTARAFECRQAATELRTLVAGLGGKAEDSGSVVGAMHRGWVSVKAAFTRRDDLSVLQECERGEDAAVESYRKALEHDLPQNVRTVVSRQFDGVNRNHAEVRQMRGAAKS